MSNKDLNASKAYCPTLNLDVQEYLCFMVTPCVWLYGHSSKPHCYWM